MEAVCQAYAILRKLDEEEADVVREIVSNRIQQQGLQVTGNVAYKLFEKLSKDVLTRKSHMYVARLMRQGDIETHIWLFKNECTQIPPVVASVNTKNHYQYGGIRIGTNTGTGVQFQGDIAQGASFAPSGTSTGAPFVAAAAPTTPDLARTATLPRHGGGAFMHSPAAGGDAPVYYLSPSVPGWTGQFPTSEEPSPYSEQKAPSHFVRMPKAAPKAARQESSKHLTPTKASVPAIVLPKLSTQKQTPEMAAEEASDSEEEWGNEFAANLEGKLELDPRLQSVMILLKQIKATLVRAKNKEFGGEDKDIFEYFQRLLQLSPADIAKSDDKWAELIRVHKKVEDLAFVNGDSAPPVDKAEDIDWDAASESFKANDPLSTVTSVDWKKKYADSQQQKKELTKALKGAQQELRQERNEHKDSQKKLSELQQERKDWQEMLKDLQHYDIFAARLDDLVREYGLCEMNGTTKNDELGMFVEKIMHLQALCPPVISPRQRPPFEH